MEYPKFFEAHIQDVIDRYNAARALVKNAASFVFITDVHIHLNGRASVPLILRIGESTDVKTVVCGGDHCWAFGSKAQCVADFADSLQYMDPIRDNMMLYHVRGNHDATVRSSWELDTGYTMPYDQVQKLFSDHGTKADFYEPGKLYGYVDDAKAKVRFVILDTTEHQLGEDAAWGVQYGMSKEQLAWLCDRALRLPGKEWAVIVFGHVPCVQELTGSHAEYANLRLVLETFKNKGTCEFGDFTNADGELIAYICGHNHHDGAATVNGLLHISTGCDSYCKDDGISRDVGKAENTLFDLFLVDKDERSIQVFRVGAGQDRAFRY